MKTPHSAFSVFPPLPITAAHNTTLGYRKNKTVLKNAKSKILHAEATAPLMKLKAALKSPKNHDF